MLCYWRLCRHALATVAFSEDGAALPAMEADDIDFLFGPALDRMAA
jgi:hypothetical protein